MTSEDTVAQAIERREKIVKAILAYQNTMEERYVNHLYEEHLELIKRAKKAYELTDKEVYLCLRTIAKKFDIEQGYQFSNVLAYYLRDPANVENYIPQTKEA